MLSTPKISVIIPAYNSERTIKNSVTSVLLQTYTNIEVIVVNDGSEDDTRTIIESYCLEDNRVKLIDQNNSGVSSARNRGLSVASGEYIFFLDSDDTLSSNAILDLYERTMACNSDLTACLIMDNHNLQSYSLISDFTAQTIDEIGKLVFYMRPGCAAGKLFRHSVIRENNLKFDEDMSLAEDMVFVHQYLTYCNVVAKVSSALYKVNDVNDQSLSKQYVKNLMYCCNKRIDAISEVFARFPLYKVEYYKYQMDMDAEVCINYAQNIFAVNSPYNFLESMSHIDNELIKSGKINCFYRLTGDTNAKRKIDKIYVKVFKTKSKFIIAFVFKCKQFIKTKRTALERIKN